MAWNDKIQVKKGNFLEKIVDEYLASRGLIPYYPCHEGPHPFDRLCATTDKKHLCIVDSKAKARRNFYEDTGINMNVFDEYKGMRNKYKVPLWLFFGDELAELIYGNELGKLIIPVRIGNKKYPSKEINRHEIWEIYFPLVHMKIVKKLTPEEVSMLKILSSRSYDYGDK